MVEPCSNQPSSWPLTAEAMQIDAVGAAVAQVKGQMQYEDVEHPAIVLPHRVRHDDYARRPVPPEIVVPEIY